MDSETVLNNLGWIVDNPPECAGYVFIVNACDDALDYIGRLQQKVNELEQSQKILTDYIELADETGYIDGHGFVDVENHKYKPPKENE